MTTYITRLDGAGSGPRVAVKDLIDVEGVPTTAGSRAVARGAGPAARDAPCLAGLREADARIVGKANLHELAMLPLGTNPWFGTPVNPLDRALIPGGSSSGCAVAVGTGEADVALGSDTGGSIRIPSACCGTAGLKTTYGRVSLEGVWPLAPSFDTVGPMAANVAGLVLGMQLLEPGFTPRSTPARVVGRLRTSGDQAIEEAVDRALRDAELEVVDIDWDGFETGGRLFATIYFAELWELDRDLVERNPDDVGEDIKRTLAVADMFRTEIEQARAQLPEWRRSLFALLDRVELLALPTIPTAPPRLDSLTDADAEIQTTIAITANCSLFNAAGVPCTAQPVPVAASALPASLQLVGPLGGEELLLPTAQRVEAAVAR